MLVRALEPTVGLELMRARRGSEDARRLCVEIAVGTRIGLTRGVDTP